MRKSGNLALELPDDFWFGSDLVILCIKQQLRYHSCTYLLFIYLTLAFYMRSVCPSLLTYIIIMILTLVPFTWESCRARRPMGWTGSGQRTKLGPKHWTIQVAAIQTIIIKKKYERKNWLQGQPLQHRGYFHAPMLEGHKRKAKAFVAYLFIYCY